MAKEDAKLANSQAHSQHNIEIQADHSVTLDLSPAVLQLVTHVTHSLP